MKIIMRIINIVYHHLPGNLIYPMYTIIPSISYATNYLSINVLNINLYTQMQKTANLVNTLKVYTIYLI